jgi:hypothetical protein
MTRVDPGRVANLPARSSVIPRWIPALSLIIQLNGRVPLRDERRSLVFPLKGRPKVESVAGKVDISGIFYLIAVPSSRDALSLASFLPGPGRDRAIYRA